MNDHIPILRRVGIALVLIGIVDIGWMIWCVSHKVSYHSSFNIFALVAGILLLRGSLKTAKYVRYFAIFYCCAFIMLPLVTPFIFPLDYWMILFRQSWGSFIFSILFGVVGIALLFWIQKSLGRPEISQAQMAMGIVPPTAKKPIILGILLPVGIVTAIVIIFHGETAMEVLRRARTEHGDNYKYVVTQMNSSSSPSDFHVSAAVVGYNSQEIKSFKIEWDKHNNPK